MGRTIPILAFALATASLSSCFLPKAIPILNDIITGNTIHHKLQTELEINAFVKAHFDLDFGPDDKKIPPKIKNARNTIMDANAEVDDPDGRFTSPDGKYKEKDYGPAHFDDELFILGQDRLMILRSEMITALQTGDVERARIWLGRQLHALQDFYSHSNWVEQNPSRSDISPVIGTPGARPYNKASRDTCTDFCLDPNKMRPSLALEYLKDLKCYRDCFIGDQTITDLIYGATCSKLFCTSPDEICAKDSDGNVCAPGQQYACERNVLNFDEVTSGYYLVLGAPASEKPSGRCSHGGMNDNGTHGVEGINKDSEMRNYAPHWFHHQKAAELSRKATQAYIQGLTQDWGSVTLSDGTLTQHPALTDRQLRLLFGVGSSTLAFVIDTTGSMGDIISSVQQTAVDIVNQLKNTDSEPTGYVLLAYNDPIGGGPLATANADQFIRALLSLGAAGGDDCPEPAISAIALALERVSSYSNIFLFTDAQAKDPANLGTATALAKKKNTQVTVFQFPSKCSASAPYNSIAGETGGTYFGLSGRAATPDLVDFAIKQIAPDIVPLYNDFPLSSGDSAPTKRASVTTEVLVDSTMRTVIFNAPGKATLEILRPDGTKVSSGDAGVKIKTTRDFTYVTINSPTVGVWKVTRSDTTSTGLTVSANSFLTFSKFDFVELKGLHPGWFPITAPIVPGVKYNVTADVEGELTTASFQFRDRVTGEILKTFELTHFSGPPNLPDEHIWYGEVSVPCGAFYALVTGKDVSGLLYQRVYPSIFGAAGNCNTTAPCSVPGWNCSTTSTSSILWPTPTQIFLPTYTSSGARTSWSGAIESSLNLPVTLTSKGSWNTTTSMRVSGTGIAATSNGTATGTSTAASSTSPRAPTFTAGARSKVSIDCMLYTSISLLFCLSFVFVLL